MKICVYAIAKNEEKFVNRWYESVKEADEIFVLDTGSKDNTIKLLKNKKITVKQEIIKPWRFDVARNKSLQMLPKDTDICVCIDLDEVLEKNWRQKLENIWTKDTTRLKYNYNWSFDEYSNPAVTFYTDKIHKLQGYKWVGPVHEVLKYNSTEVFKITDKITVNHYPDNKKTRNYLPLLELAVKEDPQNDRNMHYLGREYMYHGKNNKCIDTLIKHLNLKTATWKDERSASMRFISRSYKNLNRFYEAEMWLQKAIKETPYLREPYTELAILYYDNKQYKQAEEQIKNALKIKTQNKTYINEPFCYNSFIYDLMSIIEYNLEKYKESLSYCNTAIKLDPNNQRLINNKKIIEKALN